MFVVACLKSEVLIYCSSKQYPKLGTDILELPLYTSSYRCTHVESLTAVKPRKKYTTSYQAIHSVRILSSKWWQTKWNEVQLSYIGIRDKIPFFLRYNVIPLQNWEIYEVDAVSMR